MNIMLFFTVLLTLIGSGKPAHMQKVVICSNVQISDQKHRKVVESKDIPETETHYQTFIHPHSPNDDTDISELIASAKKYSNPVSSDIVCGISKPEYVSDERWAEFASQVKNGGKWVLLNFAHSVNKGQRFIAYEGEKKVNTGLISGAIHDVYRPLNKHPKNIPHNHLGLFKVTYREENYKSKQFHCRMTNSLFYWHDHGHAIHACQVKDIKKLGTPASHGCTRTSPQKAEELFNWAGKDPVVVITIK